MEQSTLEEFTEEAVDHITVIEGFLKLNTDKNILEREIKELKASVLCLIDQMGNK